MILCIILSVVKLFLSTFTIYTVIFLAVEHDQLINCKLYVAC